MRVKARAEYSLSGWEGKVVDVKDNPKGWVIVTADRTGYQMAFAESYLEKI